MKKLLLITCFLTSTFAMAIPRPAVNVIQDFMQSEQLRTLLIDTESFEYDFVNVEKFLDQMPLPAGCGRFSRSGSVIKVTLGNQYADNWQSYYFFTPFSIGSEFIPCGK